MSGYDLDAANAEWAALQRDIGYQKRKAHETFDQLWESGLMTRSEAYAWLRDTTGIAHIADVGPEGCREVRRACRRAFPWLYILLALESAW